jgi:hypothetical protein
MDFWWCLKHGSVEEGPGCANNERMGPYTSHEQAAGALQRAHERTAAEDARDKAEDDW